MIERVEIGSVYLSSSGIKFRVDDVRKHGQDCSLAMVCYTNLEPTKDSPTGTGWVISESLFLKLFDECSEPERVVFLDFDGVFTITSDGVFCKDYVNRRAISLLNSVFEKTKAKIVVSSSWRVGEDRVRLNAYLDLAGIRGKLHLDFKTTSKGSGFRGEQVKEWLSRHPEVEQYAIVDDETDFFDDQLKNLVHVDMYEGFGGRDCARLLSVFGLAVDKDSLRPFKTRGVGGDLKPYYDEYLESLEKGG